jgi:hypothetical protein
MEHSSTPIRPAPARWNDHSPIGRAHAGDVGVHGFDDDPSDGTAGLDARFGDLASRAGIEGLVTTASTSLLALALIVLALYAASAALPWLPSGEPLGRAIAARALAR